MEPDTDDYASIPQFGSVGSTGKPLASLWSQLSPQELSSDNDSEDSEIMEILNPTPLSFAYPLPSSAESDAPNRTTASGASGSRVPSTRRVIDLDGQDTETERTPTRKRTESTDPEPSSPTRPAKRTKVVKKPGLKPKQKPTARADA